MAPAASARSLGGDDNLAQSMLSLRLTGAASHDNIVAKRGAIFGGDNGNDCNGGVAAGVVGFASPAVGGRCCVSVGDVDDGVDGVDENDSTFDSNLRCCVDSVDVTSTLLSSAAVPAQTFTRLTVTLAADCGFDGSAAIVDADR